MEEFTRLLINAGIKKPILTENFKNYYSIGDFVDTPLGPGKIIKVQNYGQKNERPVVKLNHSTDPDGDTFPFEYTMLKHLNENNNKSAISPEDAIDIIKMVKDWLTRRNKLRNFVSSGNYKEDFAEHEKIQEEMAYIRKLLEEYKEIYHYNTVKELFKDAQKII